MKSQLMYPPCIYIHYQNATDDKGLNYACYAFVRATQGDDTLERVLADMNLLKQVISISLCSAFGQIFIFLTISVLDVYTLTIMTTSRKCLTVCFSAFLFGHNFTQTQWLGATIVLSMTCLEVYLGNRRKKIAAEKKKIQEAQK